MLPALVAALTAAALALPAAQEQQQPPSAPPTVEAEPPPPPVLPAPEEEPRQRVHWRRSLALGHARRRAARARRAPARRRTPLLQLGPGLRRSPNRSWRRWGTDWLVRVLLPVARGYRPSSTRAAPAWPSATSATHGGDFGPRFGYIGHASHQNGLDADVHYPRATAPSAPPRSRADRPAPPQELVDRFAAAGAALVLVGPSTGLTGPRGGRAREPRQPPARAVPPVRRASRDAPANGRLRPGPGQPHR